MSETPGCEEEWALLGFQPSSLKKGGRQVFQKLRAILVLLTRLSVGRFNLVIIFKPWPDLPTEPKIQMLQNIMIPANFVDKFKGLEIANNSFTEVDLPANVRQENNNS